jgi:2-polyprenyl-3-methyl-5-hydroxy-6-metoxy-1,4-benzoquinol methylase
MNSLKNKYEPKAAIEKWKLVEKYLTSNDKTLLDVGCNFGYLVKKAYEKGIDSIGFESNKNFVDNKNNIKNKTLTPENIKNIKKYDVILLLSVSHQWNCIWGIAEEERMIKMLGNKSNKFFFQPASIKSKYKESPNILDNNEKSIINYNMNMLKRLFPSKKVSYIGKTELDNKKEKYRYLFLVAKIGSLMKCDIKMNTLNECLNYWGKTQDQNNPANYKNKKQRSKYLINILNEYNILKESNICEIGCNCGRNLNMLYKNKYKNLTGIEINNDALNKQKKFFPELRANLINSSIEDCILKFKDNEFDTIFTMAVLQHIHNDSIWIFEHIARITNEYLFLIELNVYSWEKIFTNLGFSLIEKRSCYLIKGLEKYFAWILKKNK